MRLCIPNAAMGEAVSPMEGYGFTNLVGFIDNATETVAVLGFLMLQNWYFWTSAIIYQNHKEFLFLTLNNVYEP